VWGAVRAIAPDAFVWLGDVIYADGKVNGTRAYVGNERHRAAFETQLEHPEYAALARETKIVGTWDDHDFGFNNAGAEWEEKPFAKQVFLDFLGVPADSPRRERAGVYAHHTFRNLGRDKNRSARLILLDTRFHQRAERGELLGEDQWRWLERALGVRSGSRRVGVTSADDAASKSPSSSDEHSREYREPFIESEESDDDDPVDVVIIGSSIQVHAETQKLVDGLFEGVESWNEFPNEKKRLLDLVERSRARVVFLSGDVHHAEIITSPPRCVLPYELVEITSSGMTHGILDEVPKKHGLRAFVRLLIPAFLPRWLWPDVGGLQRARFIHRNWGEVAIDFGDDDAAETDAADETSARASPSPGGEIRRGGEIGDESIRRRFDRAEHPRRRRCGEDLQARALVRAGGHVGGGGRRRGARRNRARRRRRETARRVPHRKGPHACGASAPAGFGGGVPGGPARDFRVLRLAARQGHEPRGAEAGQGFEAERGVSGGDCRERGKRGRRCGFV
jgi:alkaline phosphatase D